MIIQSRGVVVQVNVYLWERVLVMGIFREVMLVFKGRRVSFYVLLDQGEVILLGKNSYIFLFFVFW